MKAEPRLLIAGSRAEAAERLPVAYETHRHAFNHAYDLEAELDEAVAVAPLYGEPAAVPAGVAHD